MNLLGTTGTRAVKGSVWGPVKEYIYRPESKLYWESFDGYVSGGCTGWDHAWGVSMASMYPEKKHIVVLPANRSQVHPWWEQFDLGSVELIEMPENSDYGDRNEKIVQLSSALFYCADFPEDHGKSLRSGTWMTVRIGRRGGMVPSGIILNDVTKDNDA